MFINHNFEIWHKNAYKLSCCVNTKRTTKKKKSNYFQMRISLSLSLSLSLFLMLELEECPNFINLKYALHSPFFCFLWMPPTQPKTERMKKKNTEWKWATESLASGVGVGGRVTALEFIIKLSSECFRQTGK